jgi:hypothetical protein
VDFVDFGKHGSQSLLANERIPSIEEIACCKREVSNVALEQVGGLKEIQKGCLVDIVPEFKAILIKQIVQAERGWVWFHFQ